MYTKRRTENNSSVLQKINKVNTKRSAGKFMTLGQRSSNEVEQTVNRKKKRKLGDGIDPYQEEKKDCHESNDNSQRSNPVNEEFANEDINGEVKDVRKNTDDHNVESDNSSEEAEHDKNDNGHNNDNYEHDDNDDDSDDQHDANGIQDDERSSDGESSEEPTIVIKPKTSEITTMQNSVNNGTNNSGTIHERSIIPLNRREMMSSPNSKRMQEKCLIRKYTTDRVFRGVKFVNTRKMMQQIMGKVSTHFQLEPNDKSAWELCFEKDVRYALNNKRNSVSQDIKKVVLGKFFI